MSNQPRHRDHLSKIADAINTCVIAVDAHTLVGQPAADKTFLTDGLGYIMGAIGVEQRGRRSTLREFTNQPPAEISDSTRSLRQITAQASSYADLNDALVTLSGGDRPGHRGMAALKKSLPMVETMAQYFEHRGAENHETGTDISSFIATLDKRCMDLSSRASDTLRRAEQTHLDRSGHFAIMAQRIRTHVMPLLRDLGKELQIPMEEPKAAISS